MPMLLELLDRDLEEPCKTSVKHRKTRPLAVNGDHSKNSGKTAILFRWMKPKKAPKKHYQITAGDNLLKVAQKPPTIAEFLRRQPPLPPSTSSSSSSHHMNFRQTTRDRLLKEMLGSLSRSQHDKMRVLIMDDLTTKIMSSACKMSELFEQGIALVEPLHKPRSPLLSMDAVYFMQPTAANVAVFLSDMSGTAPHYNKAFVFFTSPEIEDRAAGFKIGIDALPRIGAMLVMNIEYLAVDAHAYLTGHETAMEDLFAELACSRRCSNASINAIAARIATVLVSLNEFPCVRYRAGRSASDASVEASAHDLAPTMLAAAVWNCVNDYKAEIPTFPEKETCEILIVDRAIDLIVPVMHDWSYETMCFDLLPTDGNKYTPAGSQDLAILDDHDSLWVELRHKHAIEASERLCEKGNSIFKTIRSAAAAQARAGDASGVDVKMFQSLLQCAQKKEKISLHVEIAGRINEAIKAQKLQEIGGLEEDLASGRAKSKDLVKFLKQNHEHISNENKLRLVMIYASLHPEEMIIESEKLMQIANLSPIDQIVVKNMSSLAEWDARKKSEISSKQNLVGRIKSYYNSDSQNFRPALEDLIEKLNRGDLSEQDYPYINAPGRNFRVITKRTRYSSTASGGASLAATSIAGRGGLVRLDGKRIFVFVIGGATRSEIHAAARLSSELKREIILGSTSLDDPLKFVTKMRMLSAQELE